MGKNDFVLLIGGIGVDTSITNVEEYFGLVFSFHKTYVSLLERNTNEINHVKS